MIIKNIILLMLLLCITPSYAASVQTIRITGGDGLFFVDVVEEKGKFKLLAKTTSAPESLGDLFWLYAEKAGSNEMAVNGSVIPETFSIMADPTADLVVSTLIFQAFSSIIKIDKFLGLNSELTNGVLIEVKSEDSIFQFLPIKNTIEFDSLFSNGSARSYDLIFPSGNDSMVARFGLSNPFVLKKTGTFATDDYVKVIIRDNISSVTRLRFIAEGTRE